jgi:hypothetical protein
MTIIRWYSFPQLSQRVMAASSLNLLATASLRSNLSGTDPGKY